MRRLAVLLVGLAGCGGATTALAGSVKDTSIESDFVGKRLDLRIVTPDGGGKGRPLLVFLHGRGASVKQDSSGFRRGYEKLGRRAPVVAFPSGGESSYWHDREDGDWGRYVLREVIPELLDRTGADPGRVAIGGISMGGFGALDLASRAKRRFCAVGAHSPAIWQTAGETAPGAFDDADDFARHDVIARAAKIRAKLWVDIGRADPFVPGATAFAEAAGTRLRRSEGGHDGDYWNRRWPAYLRFYARSCKKPS